MYFCCRPMFSTFLFGDFYVNCFSVGEEASGNQSDQQVQLGRHQSCAEITENYQHRCIAQKYIRMKIEYSIIGRTCWVEKREGRVGRSSFWWLYTQKLQQQRGRRRRYWNEWKNRIHRQSEHKANFWSLGPCSYSLFQTWLCDCHIRAFFGSQHMAVCSWWVLKELEKDLSSRHFPDMIGMVAETGIHTHFFIPRLSHSISLALVNSLSVSLISSFSLRKCVVCVCVVFSALPYINGSALSST